MPLFTPSEERASQQLPQPRDRKIEHGVGMTRYKKKTGGERGNGQQRYDERKASFPKHENENGPYKIKLFLHTKRPEMQQRTKVWIAGEISCFAPQSEVWNKEHAADNQFVQIGEVLRAAVSASRRRKQ